MYICAFQACMYMSHKYAYECPNLGPLTSSQQVSCLSSCVTLNVLILFDINYLGSVLDPIG